MGRPGRQAALAAAALVGAAFALAPLVAAADAPPKTAADCRAITDFALRGQCWDSLDQTNQQATETAKEAKKREFGLGMHIPSVSALKPRAEDRAREAKAEQEDIKTQTITLASVDNTPVGKLLLTSSEGAVWEQTDSDPVTNAPEPGDTVTVSKGMMGGFMCKVSAYQSVRCQRDR